MLLKNGEPCMDVYQWVCDECGKKGWPASAPTQSQFGCGQPLHNMIDDKIHTFCSNECCEKFSVREGV